MSERYNRIKHNLKKYRENNRLKVNAIQRKYQAKNRDSLKAKYELKKQILQKKCNRKTELLTEAYMIKHLKKLGYSETDIKLYPDLIQTHRIIIKSKRLWKKSQTSAT